VSDIGDFIKTASRYPLLTQTQEIELGRRIQTWLQHPSPSKAIIRSGRRARDQFICSNLRLVVAIAKRYTSRLGDTGLTFQDLLQEGTLGLQRAAEKYDPECGYKMSTYAYWWIRQAITRSLDMKSLMIHVPYEAKRKLRAYMEAAKEGGGQAAILKRANLKHRDISTVQQAAMCQKVGALDALDIRL
jgi:RNA polymerase sigma factor (sigma-70 family)